jgi:hypothetical protein
MNLLPLTILQAVATAAGIQDSVSETVKLRYVHPSRLAQVLKLPFELEQITFNFKDKTVIMRGSRKAVLSTIEQVFDADVNIDPFNYKLGLRLTERIVRQDGKVTERLVNDSSATVTVGNPVTISTGGNEASGHTVVVQISPSAVGQVTLEVTMNMRDQAGNVLFTSMKKRKVNIGERVAIGGMTDVKNIALRDAIDRGDRPKDRGDYSALYVELTVSNLPGLEHK